MTTNPSPVREVDESLPMVARRHPDWWIAAVIAIAVAVLVVSSLASNEKLDWEVFAKYIAAAPILEGLVVTIQLTVVSMLFAVTIGFLMASLAQSANPVLRAIAKGYIGFFRGLPLLVLLLVTFNLALFIPEFGIHIPGVIEASIDTNDLISGFTASIIGLALHESAFMAEIVRGGVLAVPPGQLEAAQSVGMTRWQAIRTIVYPQAVRVIIPPTGNQFIMLLKASSMVAVIGGGDLLTRAQQIYGQNFKVIPLLLVVSFWYLVLVGIASFGQSLLEKRLARGAKIRPVVTTEVSA
jgi:polar amino acid transport system permease protein